MPLQNNAKITDIITELSDMQAVNQKAELASVIGAPVVGTDNVATQITKLQTAKDTLATNLNAKGVTATNTEPIQTLVSKVGEIAGSVSGSTYSNPSNLSFYYRSGGGISMHSVQVSGLPKKPKRITMFGQISTSWFCVDFDEDFLGNENVVRVSHFIGTVVQDNTYNIRLDGSSAYVNDTGFRLPCLISVNGGAINYNWKVYF